MKNIKSILILILVLLFGCLNFTCSAPTETVEITEEDIIISFSETILKAKDTITIEEQTEMLTWFASDDLEGRSSGEDGNVEAATFIAKEFEKYGLLPGMEDSYYQPFHFNARGQSGDTNNVIGYFPGNDPKLKDEVIVIGAHLDHIGYGYYASRGGTGQIHNGADDNGSGIMGILEIAEAFSQIKDELNRTIVFIAFSGEELGLLGSFHYCDHPIFPIEDTIFMCNLDMIGWLKDNTKIYSYDTTNKTIKAIIRKLDDNYPFNTRFQVIRGSSDQYPFFRKKVPVSFLSTGLHAVYHTPKDDTELIDFEGMKIVTDFAFELILLVDQLPQRP